MQEVLTEEQLKKRKLHRARVSLGCMVLILAVGVVGNWYWENSDISTKISTVSAQRTKTLGEATFVDATTEAATENSYFTQAKLDRQSGNLIRHNAVDENKDGLCDLCGKEIDISAVMAAYHSQNIATIDQRIGKAMGIYGESCELLYASTEEQPRPRSAVYAPDQIVLVQDDTVEHKDLFALWFEQRERTDRSRYYAVTVYTATQYQQYESLSLIHI